MPGTWPRSPPRTSPANGWWPARTRSWKPSGPASANRCWPPPRPTWTRSPQPARGPADRVLRRRKVAKHFTVQVTDDSLSYTRDQDSITAEAKLDGIYVLRTSVQAGDLDSPEVI